MFKMLISGRTIEELKKNMQEMACVLQDGLLIEDEHVDMSQLPLAPVAAAPQPAREIPPTPPVPQPEPAKPMTQSNEFGVDSRGWPWDERIHAVTQGTNKDGSWRNRRGVEPVLVAQVEAELGAKYGTARRSASHANPPPIAPQPVQTPSPLGPPPTAYQDPRHTSPGPVAPIAQVVPSSQPAPTPITPKPVTSAHTAATFKANLVGTLAHLVSEGNLTQDYINQLKSYFKVEQVWQLNDEQSNLMFQNFVEAGLIQRAQ